MLSGILAGLGEASAKDREQQAANNRNLLTAAAENWRHISENPNISPEGLQHAVGTSILLTGTNPYDSKAVKQALKQGSDLTPIHEGMARPPMQIPAQELQAQNMPIAAEIPPPAPTNAMPSLSQIGAGAVPTLDQKPAPQPAMQTPPPSTFTAPPITAPLPNSGFFRNPLDRIRQEGQARADIAASESGAAEKARLGVINSPENIAAERDKAAYNERLRMPSTPAMMYDRDSGEPVPAQWVLDTSDPKNPKWNLQPLHIIGANGTSGTENMNNPQGNLTVAPRSPSKIISDPKAGPFAIERPNGKRFSPDDPLLTPQERADFKMAQMAHEKGTAEESTLGQKNLINAYISQGMTEDAAHRQAGKDLIAEQKAKGAQRSEANSLKENENESRLRDTAIKRLDQENKTIEPHITAINTAIDTISSGGSLADSLLAPTLLKALVAGGGVRITQAEIQGIAKSSTNPQNFLVTIHKWIDDPSSFSGVPPIVKEQALKLLQLAKSKADAKKQILSDAEDALNATHSQQGSDFNSHVTNAKRQLNAIDSGKAAAIPSPGGTITMPPPISALPAPRAANDVKKAADDLIKGILKPKGSR